MAWPGRELRGTVESVGRGIARSDGELGPDLLPGVTPTFDWIRLAQRFPVRVRLDELPPDIDLRVGLTASVQILEKIDEYIDLDLEGVRKHNPEYLIDKFPIFDDEV